jgi:ADP-ribose pyrophosphatase
MTTIIITDNLVNDYCGHQPRFLQKNVNIGLHEIERLFGSDKELGEGALPTFLRLQVEKDNTRIIFFKDSYSYDDQMQQEYLERLGEHCMKGSVGEEFIDFLKGVVAKSKVLNSMGLSFPLEEFRQYINALTDVDIFSYNLPEVLSKVRFLLVGFHTERRIFSTANILKNLFGFPNVAVFSHFLSSSNKEYHFTALRYQFPDSFIKVINSPSELGEYLEEDLSYLNHFGFSAVDIKPLSIKKKLSYEQHKIIELICMHWTEVSLLPLGGGFSGSALFVARGKQGSSKTEPMVIKIDTHYPIQLEVKGYNLVKDFLGKHIPTFTLPVIKGQYSGIGMELASMEGSPVTLQDHFEKAYDDYALNDFLKLLDRCLSLLSERIYSNTLIKKRMAPFRHFGLHITQQENWLSQNIKNINQYQTDQVIISGEIIINIFNVIRKNSDAVFTEMCIAHGDLNLANIIVDNQSNLWVIDWTHTGLHPLAIDFAKMENDVKFVMSKELNFEDLPKLKILEDFLLTNLLLPTTKNLPGNMQFVKWDHRFKKIYLTIRKLRAAYTSLKENDNWLIYKIALLRYGLHTLSFDKTIDQGECTPPQLWYALLSIETIVFELLGDDYHLKIRSERPDHYPERKRIHIDLANWQVPYPEYDPPYYVSQDVLENYQIQAKDKYADPENKWAFEDFIDWGRPYVREEDQKPLNPSGRTGIAGRGSLGLWGSNPMLFLTPIRYNKDTKQLEILINSQDENSEIMSIHFRRGEKLQEATKRMMDKFGFNLDKLNTKEVHEGYLYDQRQTDNAWIDAKSFVLFLEESIDYSVKENFANEVWKTINPKFINDLYSSYGYIVRQAVKYIYESSIVKEDFITKILEKTG